MLSQEELDKMLAESAGTNQAGSGDPGGTEGNGADLDWSAAFAEAAAGGDKAAAKAVTEGGVSPGPEEKGRGEAGSRVNFQEFSKTGPVNGMQVKPNLDIVLDIPLQVSVELGRTRMQIRDLLQLSQGAVVPLEKEAGDVADIYVNQKLMAKGEVVIVNERFGVRLTEIVSPADRVKGLG